jgi:O-antigen/teichoic acid export membrane protein
VEQSVLTAAKGGSILFAGTMAAFVVRFVMGIVLARALGSEQYGLYSVSLTTATLVAGLAMLGMSSALVRYVSLFASRRDEEGLWGTLQIGIGIPTALSLVLAIGLFAAAVPIAESLFHEPKLTSPLRVISLAVPFLTLGNTLAAATRGFKKMQYTAIAKSIVQPTLKLLLILLLAIAGMTATQALAAHTVSVIVVVLLLAYFLNSLFRLRRPLRSARRPIRDIIKFSLPLYGSRLVRIFRSNIQTVLLGALSSVTSVGIFTVVSQVNMVGRIFHDSIVDVSDPIVSELHSLGEREELARFYRTMTKWTLTLNLPFFLIVLLFPGPVLSIFGEDYVSGTLALLILAWGSLINAGTGISGVVLNMTGHTFWSLVNTIVLSVLLIGLNVWLIPTWGVVGAAVASLTSMSLVNLMRLVEVVFLLRLWPYDRSFLKPVVAAVDAGLAAWIAGQLLPAGANLGYLILSVAVLFIVYLGVLLMLGLSAQDRVVLARMGKRLGLKWFK